MTERQGDHLALPLVVALAVMVVWGGTAVFTKIATEQMDPLLVGILRTVLGACLALPTTLWGISLSAVVLLPLLAWSLWSGGVPEADAAAWGSILALATLVSVLGYIGWYWALAKGGISRIASTQFTEPLFGVALAAVVLGERPAPVTLVGAAGVLLGAWLVLRAGRAAGIRSGARGVDAGSPSA